MAKVPFRERYRVSRLIFRQTWGLLRDQRDLWLFPLLALLAILPALALFVGVMFVAAPWSFEAMGRFLGAFGPLGPLLFVPAVMVVMFPFMVLGTLLNAALVFCAFERLEGRPGRKMDGWRRAVAQFGPILRFSVIAALVSGVLSIVGQLLEKLRLVPYLGQVTQTIGAFAWAAASFFVIPILVVEGERSAVQALRGSVGLAREQWGKSVAGLVTIGLVFMVPTMVLLLLFMPLMMAGVVFSPGGLGVIASALVFGVVLTVLVMLMAVVSSTAQMLYQTALYRYARTGIVSLPYTPETLVDAWGPYQR